MREWVSGVGAGAHGKGNLCRSEYTFQEFILPFHLYLGRLCECNSGQQT